jgi:ribosome-binding protein aMBF1 (putative translation factor)
VKQAKRKRLEAGGWRVGDGKQFLGLSEDEAAMIEVKLELAKALRAERTKRKLTQNELSQRLGSSQSRVAKMEAGHPSVSVDLLMRSLLRLGTTRLEIARHLGAPSKRRAA